VRGVLRTEATRLNEAFNHWILHRTPFVTVKAALTLDGRIADGAGHSQWITGTAARQHAMKHLRRGADAILVGINTVLADNPALTYRGPGARHKAWRRIVLDSRARTPLSAKLVTDGSADQTVIVVTANADPERVAELRKRVLVVEAPAVNGRIDLRWLLEQLGGEGVTSLLVEGGGEVNGAFLEQGLAHRIAFYFAPRLLAGRDDRLAVLGAKPSSLTRALDLAHVEITRLGSDWLITGRVNSKSRTH
jgi:diaminohydroxyphosphoribosylaminopyrimidine deaminase/5-amino-6-(5-phosphoribosylamino)uracil reductase